MFADADDYFLNFDFWDKISDEEKTCNQYFIFNFFNDEMGCNVKDIDIWPFGKIYKTTFLNKYNIGFCPYSTYTNEDIGFNINCRFFLDENNLFEKNISIITWKYNENSLTRKNDNEFNYK